MYIMMYYPEGPTDSTGGCRDCEETGSEQENHALQNGTNDDSELIVVRYDLIQDIIKKQKRNRH
jgi:hypothetical protein